MSSPLGNKAWVELEKQVAASKETVKAWSPVAPTHPADVLLAEYGSIFLASIRLAESCEFGDPFKKEISGSPDCLATYRLAKRMLMATQARKETPDVDAQEPQNDS